MIELERVSSSQRDGSECVFNTDAFVLAEDAPACSQAIDHTPCRKQRPRCNRSIGWIAIGTPVASAVAHAFMRCARSGLPSWCSVGRPNKNDDSGTG